MMIKIVKSFHYNIHLHVINVIKIFILMNKQDYVIKFLQKFQIVFIIKIKQNVHNVIKIPF